MRVAPLAPLQTSPRPRREPLPPQLLPDLDGEVPGASSSPPPDAGGQAPGPARPARNGASARPTSAPPRNGEPRNGEPGGASGRNGGAGAAVAAWPRPPPLPAPPPPAPAILPPPLQPVVAPEPRSPEPEPELDLEPDVDAIEVHLERASAWRRVAAWAVDLAFLGLFLALLLGPVVSRSDLPLVAGLDELYEALTRRRGVLLPAATVALVAAFAYQWLGLALMGATPGKRLLRLRVVGPDGRRPSPGRSALRAALSIPSLLVLGLGPLLALFTRSGRALHDFGARTYVVRVP